MQVIRDFMMGEVSQNTKRKQRHSLKRNCFQALKLGGICFVALQLRDTK